MLHYYNGGIFFMLGGCNFSSVNRHCSREFIEFFTVLFLLGLSIQSTRGVESNDINGGWGSCYCPVFFD